jgi:hypothetical protein
MGYDDQANSAHQLWAQISGSGFIVLRYPGAERTPSPVTVLERVRDLLVRLAPNAACDTCIAIRLGLSLRQHANKITRALAKAGGFERRKGVCGICGQTRMATRLSR